MVLISWSFIVYVPTVSHKFIRQHVAMNNCSCSCSANNCKCDVQLQLCSETQQSVRAEVGSVDVAAVHNRTPSFGGVRCRYLLNCSNSVQIFIIRFELGADIRYTVRIRCRYSLYGSNWCRYFFYSSNWCK